MSLVLSILIYCFGIFMNAYYHCSSLNTFNSYLLFHAIVWILSTCIYSSFFQFLFIVSQTTRFSLPQRTMYSFNSYLLFRWRSPKHYDSRSNDFQFLFIVSRPSLLSRLHPTGSYFQFLFIVSCPRRYDGCWHLRVPFNSYLLFPSSMASIGLGRDYFLSILIYCFY